MIADEDVTLTSRGAITVRVQQDAPKYRAATAVADGDGTPERPLCFVLLACHADMADETPADAIERSTSALRNEVLNRLENGGDDIRQVLQAANGSAAATDRYYSIVIGRVAGQTVMLAAVGNVTATLVSAERATAVITSNTVRIGKHAILNGAFGIGFKEEALNAAELQLDGDSALLLIVGEEEAAIDETQRRDARSLIEEVVRGARISPPIVAVVR